MEQRNAESEVLLGYELIAALNKLGLSGEDVSAETVKMALGDEKKQDALTPDELLAISTHFDIDLKGFGMLGFKGQGNLKATAQLLELERRFLRQAAQREIGMRVQQTADRKPLRVPRRKRT